METDRKTKPDDAGLPKTKVSAWPSFIKAQAVLVNCIEGHLRARDLPALEWYDVLWTLERAQGGRLRMSELAEATVITRSNLTRLVDRLAAEGLVARDRDCRDRRGAYAVLTPKGRRMRERIWPTYEVAIHEAFDRHLSRAETREMQIVLTRLIREAQGTRHA